MKNIHAKKFLGVALLALLFGSCSKDILDEQPRSIYTPDYFKTTNGVMGGITSLYANLRYIYGNGYYFNACETGTDEYTWAQSADANFKDMDMSSVSNLNATSSRADVAWNNAFSNINTANGIIEFAKEAGVDSSLVAEAYFFRAFDYFLLVQTFGGVPLDLGSGELKFNISPVRTSVRNTVAEVYTKSVFPDLLKAVNNLPEAGRITGGVSKTVARLYLAKAYLTYAWWLENPNGIPTYPECARTDPDKHDAKWYFQQAYDVAAAAIANPASYGLQATFYDVNVATNDRNNEILLYADHTESSEFYNGASLTYGSGGSPDNFASWMSQWNYTNVTSSKSSWVKDTVVASVQREASQALGRPWTRMAPPIGVFTTTFADKTNDSRYDGTFTTVYHANWTKGSLKNAFLYNANDLKVYPGDPILTFLDSEPSQAIDYSNTVYKSSAGVGVLPGRADYVVSPNGISRRVYPGLWKIGPYRTDNGTGLGQPNAGSTRPYNIAKFSEFFFIAAEANVKGALAKAISGTYANDGTAKGLINILRARAGVWKWYNNGNIAKVEDHSADMTALTPASITIDYILAERSREYFGEGYRWFDLVRTQKWADVAGSYQICGDAVGDHTIQTITRKIDAGHYLRPIPQGQLDALDVSEAEREAYQNPAYRN
jgi:hypothetical protein